MAIFIKYPLFFIALMKGLKFDMKPYLFKSLNEKKGCPRIYELIS